MSAPVVGTLAARADAALRDDFLRKAVRFTVDRLSGLKGRSTEELGRWEEWRERARVVRADVIANLDWYLGRFAANLEARGGRVHFAADAGEAARVVLEIARARGAKLVAKSKSMVSEEVGINHALEGAGIRAVETDLGEWIVQLAHETPSHLIVPAIHKNRAQIQALFEAEGGEGLAPETATLAGFARRRLRKVFREADLGLTGCNFALADTGSVAIFTNEGNGRMVSTLPRTHVVMMGMERILPSWEDLELMANVLPRSATGQKITTYLTVLSGPKLRGETDGPEELHVVILDNGRSDILGDPEFQEVLHCIRCGACLNVCPVYRQIGGHAYGSVYSGPIGAVLTPLLQRDRAAAAELANASSLCGACAEACPVKIPLHDMLVRLRGRRVRAGGTGWAERAAFRLYARIFGSPRAYRFAAAAARRLLPFAARLPSNGWTRWRDLPPPPGKSFRKLWTEKS